MLYRSLPGLPRVGVVVARTSQRRPISVRRSSVLLFLTAALLIAMFGPIGTRSSVAAAVGDPDPAPETQPSAAAAMSAALEYGDPVEDLSARTESASTFANPDGTWTTESTPGPFRAQDAAGQWQPIDTTLVHQDYRWMTASSPAGVSFSDGGDEAFATYTRPNGQEVTWGWSEPLPSPEVSGSTLTYPDVVPDGDLVLTALPTGFSHSLVLHSQPNAPISIEIPVDLNGADISSNDAGAITLSTQTGHELATAPAPVMWDAATTADGSPADVASVEVAVEDSGDGSSLVLTPDQDMLTDPATQYPVTIDPTFTTFAAGDGWVSSGTTTGHTESDELRVGYSASDNVKARTFLKFSSDAWAGKTILAATLQLRNFASSCTSRAINVERISHPVNLTLTSWTNQPQVAGPAFGFSNGYGCPDADTATWVITPVVSGWADGSVGNYGLRIKAEDETLNSWRKYRSAEYSISPAYQPKLTVQYTAPPDSLTITPCSADCSSPPNVLSQTPTLSASESSYPTGRINYTFQIAPSGSTAPVVAGTASAPAGSPGVWTVPSGSALANHASYQYRVSAQQGGGAFSEWTSWQAFKVDPDAPTGVSLQDGTALDEVSTAVESLDDSVEIVTQVHVGNDWLTVGTTIDPSASLESQIQAAYDQAAADEDIAADAGLALDAFQDELDASSLPVTELTVPADEEYLFANQSTDQNADLDSVLANSPSSRPTGDTGGASDPDDSNGGDSENPDYASVPMTVDGKAENSIDALQENPAQCDGNNWWSPRVLQIKGYKFWNTPDTRIGFLKERLVWGQAHLNNLTCNRYNVTWEADFKTNNYDDKHIWQKGSIYAWASNLPEAYKDTAALDGDNEYVFTVGTSDARKLTAGKTYTIKANLAVGNAERDTAALNGQRGYRDPQYCHQHAWCVEGDATEHIIKAWNINLPKGEPGGGVST